MRIEYDVQNEMWIITKKVDDAEIEVRITEWFNTEKGRLIDIAVFVSKEGESKENEFFYDFEILNCRLMAKQISEVCKEIFESYNSIAGFNIYCAVPKMSSVFPKKSIDAYIRKHGPERKCNIYVKRRYNIFTKYVDEYFHKSEIEVKKCPRPALEYPGSRLDSIL